MYSSSKDIDNKVNDEISLSELLFTLIRFKKIIFTFSLVGIFMGGLLFFNTKKVWQGEFQIVVEDNKEKSSTLSDRIPDSLIGENKKKLGTQIEILKSPSVLMEIFEFVKTNRLLKNEKEAKNLRFKKWRNDNFNIIETRKTSVLNITYEDTDKEIILPVLDKISIAYQKYSNQKRSRNLELSENYLNKQIILYKNKSLDSLRTAQQFAIDNELTVLKDAEIDKEIPNSININKIRVEASNRIKDIDFQISQLSKMNNDPNKLLYFGRFINGLQQTGLPDKLQNIEEDLAFKRLIFLEEDETIKNLIQRRNNIIPIFKEQALAILNSDKIAAQAQLELAERPKETFIKYQQLLNEAKKDKITLENIEDKYRLILLEKAKNNDPWSLITKPTLYPSPVAPRLKFYLLIGLITGFFLGNLVAIFLEKFQDIIFKRNEFERLSNSLILQNLSLKDIDSWDQNL